MKRTQFSLQRILIAIALIAVGILCIQQFVGFFTPTSALRAPKSELAIRCTLYVCGGASIGAAVGVLFGKLEMWIPLGMMVGSFGLTLIMRR
jgi:hypothetical protein